MSEKEPTAKEIREAEALARALEGDGSAPDLPEEALQTAALLRSHELGRDRQEAVFDRIAADNGLGEPGRPASRLRWLIPVGGLVAAVIAGVLLMAPGVITFSGAKPAELPKPGADLLEAQGRAASRAGQLAVLNQRMNHYRKDMYHSLSARYSE